MDTTSDLNKLLASIPPGENPYGYLAQALRNAYFPEGASSSHIRVWKALGTFLVIDIGLCLLVLLGKWRQNSLYLYKWRPTAKGSLLVPNSSAAFSIFSGIFCIVAEPYLWLTVKMQHSERILPVAFKAQNNCMAVLWTFLALALLTELHAMCVMIYLTATSSPSPQLLWIGKVSTRTFNLFFFVVFTAILVALTTSFGISEAYWNELVDLCKTAQDNLLDLALLWDGSDPEPNLIDMPTFATSMIDIAHRADTFVGASQVGFSVLFASNLLVLWLYVPAGIRYAYILGSQISADAERRQRQTIELPTAGEESLSTTYGLMICKTVLIFMGGTPSLVAGGWTAFSLKAVLQSRRSYFAVHVLAFGGFALLGTMALAVIVWMTWNMALPLGLLSFKALRSGSESAQDKPAPLDIHVRIETVTVRHPYLASFSGGSSPVLPISHKSDDEDSRAFDKSESLY